MRYIDVTGTMTGGREFVYLLNKAPRYMHQEARKWFLDIRKRFVGIQKKKKLGTYTRWLKGRNARYAKGIGLKWSNPAVSAFKGFLHGQIAGQNISMTLGTPPDLKSKFAQSLEMRQSGAYNITSSRWMPIPNYSNLIRYGYTRNFRVLTRQFLAMNVRAGAGQKPFFTIYKNGTIFYINKNAYRAGASLRRATFLKMTKSVVEPNFDFQFEDRFGNEWPKYLQLGEKRIERASRALELGYVKS